MPPVRSTVATPIVGTMENGATLQLQHARMLHNTKVTCSKDQVMEQVELLANLLKELCVRTFKYSIANKNIVYNIYYISHIIISIPYFLSSV